MVKKKLKRSVLFPKVCRMTKRTFRNSSLNRFHVHRQRQTDRQTNKILILCIMIIQYIYCTGRSFLGQVQITYFSSFIYSLSVLQAQTPTLFMNLLE